MPPNWTYILERKFNALLETGLHFVNIVGEEGSNLPLSTPTLAAFSSFFKHCTTPLIVILQAYSDDINFIVPPNWTYILERKINALLETGLHFVNIGGKGAQIYLCRHPLWRHFRVFFRSRPTSHFVIFQTYSDDINFIVPPNWTYILERKFNALLETGLHFVNIGGGEGSNLPLSTPTLAAFSSFLQIETNFAFRHISNLFR